MDQPFSPPVAPPDATAPPAPGRDDYSRAAHWFALLATAFTWPLLFVGGLVTTYKVGMAVPDWPTTFGMNMFLYDMTRAPWGVFGEHTHRLYGAAVGLFTILLMVDFLIFGRRRWIKWLGVVALIAVIGQGVLGGMRVRLNSTSLAAVHGCTAQAFFGLMVALCVWTGRSWLQGGRSPADPARAGRIGRMSLALLGLVYAQILVGAWLRHYSRVDALWLHAAMAVLVFGHGVATVVAVERSRRDWPELVPATRALAATLGVQVALGVAAWWLLRPFDGSSRAVGFYSAMVRTGHQANAGLLIGAVVVLALRAYQLTGADRPRTTARQPVRALEAVA